MTDQAPRFSLTVAVLLVAVVAVAGPADELAHHLRHHDHHALHQALQDTTLDLDQLDSWGYTALHWAGILDQPRQVAALLDAGAAVTVAGADGGTALHWLCHHDHPDLVRAMLDHGADPDLPNRWGRTPLHVAVRRGNLGAATVLLVAGADVSAATAEGWTPLHVANLAGHVPMVDLLRQAGADTEAADADGQRPDDLWRPRRAPQPVADTALDQFVGRYAVSPHLDLVVWRDADGLRVQEFAPDHLTPVAPDTFQCRAEPWQLTFTRDADGAVSGVDIAYLRRTVTAARKDTPHYVGSDACRACHPQTWVTWARSRHGLAYQRLETHWALALAHFRPRFQDVTDPAADGRCRQCHITGAQDPPRVAAASWDQGEGVGCEACHGPGSQHVDTGDALPGGLDCTGCHRRDFDRDESWPIIAHGTEPED